MKKIINGLSAFMIACTMILSTMTIVNAAGVSIKASKSSVSVGGSFTVKVTASDCAVLPLHVSASNGSVSGGATDIDAGPGASKSVTFTIKAGSAGTCTVTVSGTYADYSGDSGDHNFSKSTSVSVTAAASKPSESKPATVDNRSKDNNLSSLSVSEGKLSPEFKADTTKYNVAVGGTVTSIDIAAKAKDSKAKVSGIGKKELTVGSNSFTIKCTAENGSTKSYTIVVNVDETPVVFTEYNGLKLGVVRNLEGVNAPEGFKVTTTMLEGQDVSAYVNDNLGLTVCYLVDDEGNKGFYVVEEGTVQYAFETVEIDERIFYVVPADSSLNGRDGMKEATVTINERDFAGWIYEDKALVNYYQVYLMNEKGEKHLYDYEITELQLQIHTDSTQKTSFNIFIITTILFGVGCIGLAIFYYLQVKNKKIS